MEGRPSYCCDGALYCKVWLLLYTDPVDAEFQWDTRNLEHAARHEVSPRLVLAIAANEPRLFRNSGTGRSGSHLMIGPEDDGRFWSIVLLRISEEIWRPITGWPSTNTEIARYASENDESAKEP